MQAVCRGVQVFVDAVRIDDFSWIHFPVRIPNGFEFPEGFNQLASEHLVEKFGFRLTIAVLARNGSAVAGHEVSGLLHKRPPLANSKLTHEIKIHSAVNAALSEMPVQRGFVLVFFVEAAKISTRVFALDVATETGDWYRPYVERLDELNAIPTTVSRFAQELTRGEMAEIVYRLKTDDRTKTSMSYGDLK